MILFRFTKIVIKMLNRIAVISTSFGCVCSGMKRRKNALYSSIEFNDALNIFGSRNHRRYRSNLQSSCPTRLMHGGSQDELSPGELSDVLEKHLAIYHAPSESLAQEVDRILCGALLSRRVEQLPEKRSRPCHRLVAIHLSFCLQPLDRLCEFRLFCRQQLHVLIHLLCLLTKSLDHLLQSALTLHQLLTKLSQSISIRLSRSALLPQLRAHFFVHLCRNTSPCLMT